ncbi:MAG: DMT family transporter [Firmicutes bacterium]|nr:DMT family transporter [Bacillota bacterium]
MNEILPILFAVLAGIFTTMEASINAKLGRIVTPNIATVHSLITGVVVIVIINILKGTLNQYSKIIYVRPQWLIGGVFGTFIIYLVTKTIPQLGVTTTLTIVVSAQVISGLFVDVFILREQQLYLYKLSGVILLIIGTYFVIK